MPVQVSKWSSTTRTRRPGLAACASWPALRFGVFLSPPVEASDRRRHGLESHDKSRSPVSPETLGFDDSAVGRDHGFGNGQTEPETPEPPCDGALALLERVKNRLELIRLDSDAGVRGPDFDCAR